MPLVSSARTPTARKKPFIGWVVPYGYQYFHNTNTDNTDEQYTFVVPSFVFQLAVCCIGGGASGHRGEANYDNSSGGGGGGGALHWRNIDVSPGDVLYIQVGHGGTHDFYNLNYKNGVRGGESYVKSGSHSGNYLLRATGGFSGQDQGGTGATSTAPRPGVGVGGINYSSSLGGGGGDGGQGGNGWVNTIGRFIIRGGGGGGTGGYNGNGGIGGWMYSNRSTFRFDSTYNSGNGYSGAGGPLSQSTPEYGEVVGPDGVQSDDTENHFHSFSGTSWVEDHDDAIGFDDLYHGSTSLPNGASPWFNRRYGNGGAGGSSAYSSTATNNPGDGGFGVVRIAYGRIAGKSEDVSYPYKASPNGIGW